MDAALDAANPGSVAKRRKKDELASRRAAALEARKEAFAESRSGTVHVKTEADLRRLAPPGSFGNYFDEVLKPSVSVDTVHALADRLEASSAALAARKAAFAAARASVAAARASATYMYVKTGGSLPVQDRGDFFALVESPVTTLAAVLAAADRHEAVCAIRRPCTRPGCKNRHRVIKPAMGKFGPVCGGCEKGRTEWFHRD